MNRFRKLVVERVHAITEGDGNAARPVEEWAPIFDEANEYVWDNVAQLAPDIQVESERKLKRGRERRSREEIHNRRAHIKKLGAGLQHFDDAILLAEAANRDVFAAFTKWLRGKDVAEMARSVTGHRKIAGGPACRIMTFLGLHARGCVLASEISLLAHHGYTEGASSRARSLYELTVISTFLSTKDSHPFPLTERYHLSGGVERQRDARGTNQPNPFQHEPGLEEAIRRTWGDRYFKPYGWAIPAVGDGKAKSVTFRDIEESVELGHLRHAYLSMNHAVHAGAANVISNLDNRYPFGHRTGSHVNYYAAAWVLSAAAYFLQGMQIPLMLDIGELVEADTELRLGPLLNSCRDAERVFKEFINTNFPEE
ncbi:DUF5677 domain-containing protein [Streptomyces sp. NPDC056512]|uniref:DUF5677 domain-containing protein n=1 Tax=Streptomyces sp. NPDC056512 TaxID=3345846 RepID=UPI003692A146